MSLQSEHSRGWQPVLRQPHTKSPSENSFTSSCGQHLATNKPWAYNGMRSGLENFSAPAVPAVSACMWIQVLGNPFNPCQKDKTEKSMSVHVHRPELTLVLIQACWDSGVHHQLCLVLGCPGCHQGSLYKSTSGPQDSIQKLHGSHVQYPRLTVWLDWVT